MGHDMSADMRAGALHALARGLRDKGRMLVALTLSAGIERLSGELVSALGTHACLRVLNLEGNALGDGGAGDVARHAHTHTHTHTHTASVSRKYSYSDTELGIVTPVNTNPNPNLTTGHG